MSKQPKSSSTPLPQGSGGETQQAVSLLATLKPVQDFISDAYSHYKAIGYHAGGEQLLASHHPQLSPVSTRLEY